MQEDGKSRKRSHRMLNGNWNVNSVDKLFNDLLIILNTLCARLTNSDGSDPLFSIVRVKIGQN
jgi:hypothetical protein